MDKRRTWFIDFDGTIVLHKSYYSEEDYLIPESEHFFKDILNEDDVVVITTGRPEEHRTRIEEFLNRYNFKYDHILCGLPTGLRILINDKKPDGKTTAAAFNLSRDSGIDLESIS